MDPTIIPMEPEYWVQVARIYQEGIQTGHATFEEVVPSWEDWDRAHLKDCRILAVIEREVAGWAALVPISERCVYGGVAEVSVYVAARMRGRGIGTALLKRLIRDSERSGIWTLQAGIFPENQASLALHRACGFRQVGLRERIGQQKGVWRDVILLERRSDVVGV